MTANDLRSLPYDGVMQLGAADCAPHFAFTEEETEPTGRLELPTGGLRSRVRPARSAEFSNVLMRRVPRRTVLFRPHCCMRCCTKTDRKDASLKAMRSRDAVLVKEAAQKKCEAGSGSTHFPSRIRIRDAMTKLPLRS